MTLFTFLCFSGYCHKTEVRDGPGTKLICLRKQVEDAHRATPGTRRTPVLTVLSLRSSERCSERTVHNLTNYITKSDGVKSRVACPVDSQRAWCLVG